MARTTIRFRRWLFPRWLRKPALLWLSLPVGCSMVAAVGCSSSDGSKHNGSAGSDSGGTGPNGGATGTTGGATGTTGGATATTGGASGTTGGASSGTGGVTSSGGTATAGGAGGSGPTTPGLESCPQPPAGCSDAAVLALNDENTVRLGMGLDCAELVAELCTSAQNHCNYYATNVGTSCEPASAHDEISGCPLFTGVNPGDRMKAAGYTGLSWSEVMAFRNNPDQAVAGFINSVYHRPPLLSPWYRDIGYGGATKCDTIDISAGATTASTVTAVYPYANQTGVPLSFDGSHEGPTPPAPPSGWPSGSPVTLFARNVTIVSHTITIDGDTTNISHTWLADTNSRWYTLYTDTPLTANTTYHVTIQTTRSAAPLDFDWKFTTGTR